MNTNEKPERYEIDLTEVIMKKETNIRVERETRKSGITRTGHEEKGLCQYACNTGFLCGHFCTYCSTPSILRMRIKMLGYDPFEKNLCIVDPSTPERLAYDAAHKRNNWSRYVASLVSRVQKSIRKQYDINRLRFLLYPSRLMEEHVTEIKKDDAGVIWL